MKDVYNPDGRIKPVTKQLEECENITSRNMELIFRFCDLASLQGADIPTGITGAGEYSK